MANEWEFMGVGNKAVIVVKYSIFGVAFGLVSVVVVALIVQAATGFDPNDIPFVQVLLGSLPLGVIFTWLFIRNGVAASRQRMSNDTYRRLVAAMSKGKR